MPAGRRATERSHVFREFFNSLGILHARDLRMLDFLTEAPEPEKLIDWFVSVSLQEFEAVLDGSDLERIRIFLRETVDHDPYMQSKLQWLATFKGAKMK